MAENKEVKREETRAVANMGYAIIMTVGVVILSVFVWAVVIGIAGEWVDFGAIIGIFNLISIIYFGKMILSKLDK